MLQVNDVVAGYGKIQILNGLTATAEKGMLTLLIGPNGAGKSTLLKTIFGFLTPTSGMIRFEGQPLEQIPIHHRSDMGIGFLLQRISVFPELTIEENLKMGAYPIRKNKSQVKQQLEKAYTRFPVLKEKGNQSAGLLSGGQKRMLEIARTLMTNPRFILVDEPSAGLSPKLAKEVYETIDHLKQEEKITFLMVDQNVRESIKIADYVYVLDRGKVSSQSTAKDIEQNLTQVVESWLKF